MRRYDVLVIIFISILLALLLPLRVKNTGTTGKTENTSIPGYQTKWAGTPKATLLATVTAYSELDSCHLPGCPMSSGKKAYIGAIACPRKYKLGTKVEINGKQYTCEDRTARKYDGRFDIFFGYGVEAHSKALQFGKQKLEINI